MLNLPDNEWRAVKALIKRLDMRFSCLMTAVQDGNRTVNYFVQTAMRDPSAFKQVVASFNTANT